MAIPPDAAPAPIEAPFPNPASIEAELPIPAANSEGYIGAGSAEGTILSYPDVSDFVWFDLLELPVRIRSTFDVTLGRTLIGTPQADVSANETVPRTEGLSIGDLVAYPTMIRPTRPIATLRAIEDAGGNPVYEQPIGYETRLAALSRMFPPPVFVTTQEALGVAEATAQEVVQYLFDQWATIFPEFTAKPVPPLVLFAPDELGVYNRTLTTDRIFLRQPEGRERSVQTLLEQLRAVFVGYGVSVDAVGDLVIIPPPWAAGLVREQETLLAYRQGPGGWTAPLDLIGASGRQNVTGTPLAVDPAFDGPELELDLEIHMRLARDPAGPRDALDEFQHRGTRSSLSEIIRPNETIRIERELVWILSNTLAGRAVYDVTWTRPGSAGGEITIAVVTATTSFASSSFIRPGTVYISHALLLAGYSYGELGSRRRTVAGRELRLPLPAPAFDGSRVINRQTARYRDLDFVEDTPLLPSFTTRIGATSYTVPGTAYTPPATFHPFVDEDEQPLIIGDRITISYDYNLRRARNSSGLDEDDFGEVNRTGTFELASGETRSIVINVSTFEIPLTYAGHLVTLRFRYTTRDGVAGLIVDFPQWSRRTGALLPRPWFGHVLAWDTSGAVYGETGEELEVTYDETSGDPAIELSQSLYGIREGPPIEVNFFRVTYEDLLDITSSIVRWNMNPRARYVGVELTEASELAPSELGLELLLPWGEAAVLERYAYDDARAYGTVTARRRLDLVLLYPLVGAGGAAASDVENAVEETAGIAGASYALDAEEVTP